MVETRASKKKREQQDTTLTRSLDDFSEDILINILKFLPTCDAIRTNLLSRQWRTRKLWRSLPFLDFDYDHFFSRLRKDRLSRFANFIEQTLNNRSDFPIQKFRIYIEDDKYDVYDKMIGSKLGEWISNAVSHKATELVISIHCILSVFNFDLLNNSCVRNVTLSSYECKCHHTLPFLKLDSIRSMTLSEIYFSDDDTLKSLILWCTNLETLVISSCLVYVNNLEICSSTLKFLTLEKIVGSSLKICCFNVYYLCVTDVDMEEYDINVSPSLEEAKVYAEENELKWWMIKVTRQLICVKLLIIQNYVFELLCENDAFLDGLLFENLNYLELDTGCGVLGLIGMAKLLKICPNITKITLNISTLLLEDDDLLVPSKLVNKPVKFTIPNLKILNLKNSMGKDIEELVRLIKKDGAALEKIDLWDRDGKKSSIPI